MTIRWSRMGNAEGETSAHRTMQEIVEDEAIEKLVHENNLIFNQNTKTLDMSKLKCTNMAMNRRVIMPQPWSPKEEALLKTRIDLWLKETDTYM